MVFLYVIDVFLNSDFAPIMIYQMIPQIITHYRTIGLCRFNRVKIYESVDHWESLRLHYTYFTQSISRIDHQPGGFAMCI